MGSQARHWCWTLNNPTEAEAAHIRESSQGEDISYSVFGYEVGENGTPHLQGYTHFTRPVRLSVVKSHLSPRIHAEVKRGTPLQASAYCKKDGRFEEYGTLPGPQGRRTEFDRFGEYVSGLTERPQRSELLRLFFQLMARHEQYCWDLIDYHLSPVQFVDSDPHPGWQEEAVRRLEREPPHDREIQFYVDPVGNSGKTWLAKYMLQKYPEKVQILGVAKRDDMACAIDVTKSIFFIDVPRDSSEFLQYSVLEMLKDRLIFSPKYKSTMKILLRVPHVCVMMNETPNMSALSEDRYRIYNISIRGQTGPTTFW